MHIHFVCSGNAYRSRLAEAYTKSKITDNDIIVTSSGISVDQNKYNNGPISWYAMRIIKRNNLIPYMAWHEKQTTKEMLKDVEVLICMEQKQYEFCKTLGYKGRVEVWDIPDLDETEGYWEKRDKLYEKDLHYIKLTEKTFLLITQKSDELLFNIALK